MVVDQNGENPVTGMISSITPEGTVTMMEEGRHGLEDGDVVTFEEVIGLDVNKKEFKVEVKTADTFSIGSVEGLGKGYVQGGIFTQVKVPKEYKFVYILGSTFLSLEINAGIFGGARVPDFGFRKV